METTIVYKGYIGVIFGWVQAHNIWVLGIWAIVVIVIVQALGTYMVIGCLYPRGLGTGVD